MSLSGDMEELDNHFLKLLLSKPTIVLLLVMPSIDLDGSNTLVENLFFG